MYDYINMNKPKQWLGCCSNENEEEVFEKQLQGIMAKLKENVIQKNVEINKYNNIISEHVENGKKYLNEDKDEERAISEARLLDEATHYRSCLIKKKEKMVTLKRELEKCIENANTSMTFQTTSEALRDMLKNSLNITTIDEIQVRLEMSLKEVDNISKSLVPKNQLFDSLPTLENVKTQTINNEDVLIKNSNFL